MDFHQTKKDIDIILQKTEEEEQFISKYELMTFSSVLKEYLNSDLNKEHQNKLKVVLLEFLLEHRMNKILKNEHNKK
jgi:hypothetical protein